MDEQTTYQVEYIARNMSAYYTGKVFVTVIEEDPKAKAIRAIRREVGPGLLIDIKRVKLIHEYEK